MNSLLESEIRLPQNGTPPVRVVMRKWNDDLWVVHYLNLQTMGYFLGAYCPDLLTAGAHYFERVARLFPDQNHA